MPSKSRRKRRNHRSANNWRRRAGSISRWLAVAVAAIAAILSVRQGELFYPVDEPYSRGLYRHWTDADKNCRSTRDEVLVQESLNPVTFDASGCRVVSGRWFDPFTGVTVTDPKKLDIDHLVPLAEAHRSGAHSWSKLERTRYANDLDHPDTLIAVLASTNRSKADKDPLLWLPPDWSYRCDYVDRWVATKMRWGLKRDLLEEWWTNGLLWFCDKNIG